MLRVTYKILYNPVFYRQSRNLFREVDSPSLSRPMFLVIPEIAEDSNLLNIDSIYTIPPHDVFVEVSKFIQNFEAKVAILNDKFSTHRKDQTFNYDNSVLEMYRILEEIDSKFKLIRAIAFSSDDRITRTIVWSLLHKIEMASNQLLKSADFGFILNELLKRELNDFQQKVVEMMKNNYTKFGRYLPKNKMDTMEYHIRLLLKYQMIFNANIDRSKVQLEQFVGRTDLSEDTPEWLLKKLEVANLEKSYRVDMSTDASIHEFLKYCINPLIRNQVWLSARQIGGRILFDFKSSNYKAIKEIRSNRKSIANLLGFENYVSFIFNSNNRMAKSLDDVMLMLEKYKHKIIPLAEEEFIELNRYAVNNKGLKESLMPWDNDYIQRCFSLEVLKCPWSQLEINDVTFNLDLVLERIFSILHKMFHVTFTKKHIRSNEIAYIISANDHVGEIVFRINKRSHGKVALLLPLKELRDNKMVKVSYMLINLPFDSPNIFDCLEIFGYFGKMLAYQLGPNDIQVSPLYTGLPPDAINISSQFLLHSFLSSKLIFGFIFPELGLRTIQALSESYAGKGIKMNYNQIASVVALYVAYFDIEMSLANKSWQDVQMELWCDFFGSSRVSKLYFPFPKMDEWPCSAVGIFSDTLWGGVKEYSLFWTDDVVNMWFQQFVSANFCNWNPNEDLNPKLSNLFFEFKKTFIEERNTIRQPALK